MSPRIAPLVPAKPRTVRDVIEWLSKFPPNTLVQVDPDSDELETVQAGYDGRQPDGSDVVAVLITSAQNT